MLVFIHIPKTAGTTLHKIISHQYPADQVVIHHDAAGPLSELIPAGRTNLPSVVMGHLSVGLHRYHSGVRYITCMREPVARLVSHYHHALHDPAHYLHARIRQERMDLRTYVASGLSGELSNGMTRMIAGVDDFHNAVPGPETLELAKRNIEDLFDAVILSERFDEGLCHLAEKQGWTSPWYLRRKVGRYARSAAVPDAACRVQLEEQNALDVELYEWCRRSFEREFARCGSLAAKVSRFRVRNRLYGRALFCLREGRRRLELSVLTRK